MIEHWTLQATSAASNQKTEMHAQSFVQRYRTVPFSKTPEKYLKYQAADVKQMILEDFFESKGQ